MLTFPAQSTIERELELVVPKAVLPTQAFSCSPQEAVSKELKIHAAAAAAGAGAAAHPHVNVAPRKRTPPKIQTPLESSE